jgi:hypothetical protein
MSFLKNLFQRPKTESTSSLSPEDLEAAKKLFFDNCCSHYMMMHDGYSDEFKKYHISQKQENEWRAEYISYWVSQLSLEDVAPIRKLEYASASESLPDLFKLAEQGDSYIKLMVANTSWALKGEFGIDKNLKKQAADVAIKLWNSISSPDDVTLTEYHKSRITEANMKGFGASTPEEYVANWAKRELRGK